MSKNLITKNENQVLTGIEEVTDNERDILARLTSALFTNTKFPYELKEITKNKIVPKLKKEPLKKESLVIIDIMKQFGLDTQIQLFESVENGSMVMDIARQLIKEYDCKTPSQKATAQMVANAYVRTLEYSNTLRASRNSRIEFKLIPYFAVMSKELDRATRQYEAALNTLIRMKSPGFKINIISKNAFVAKNQQINNTITNK